MDTIEFVSSEQYEHLPLDKADRQDRAAYHQGVEDSRNGIDNNLFTYDDERFIHYVKGYESVIDNKD